VVASPFVPRQGGSGPLFTRIDPKHTGIQCMNTYADPSMWAERYEPFALGSCGTGVAIGDYDGDGRPDVCIVNKCDPVRLYRNLGEFRFSDVTATAGLVNPADGGWNQAACFVDINNDNLPDLSVTRLGAPNQLYVNQGGGVFREEAASRGFALTDASGVASFADYDRDGWLDCYVQTNLLDARSGSKGRRDRLLHNRGDGSFEEVTGSAGIDGETQGHSAIWWDYDADGWADLYVANDFAAPDRLYRNNRNGTFTDVLAVTLPHCPLFAMGSDCGDLDGDGLEDLMVADMVPSSRRADLRSMAEMRRKQVENPDPSWAVQVIGNALYRNTGLRRLGEVAHFAGLAATDWTWSVRFEDLDQDGRLDVHVTNGMVRDFFDADLLVRCAGLSRDEQRRLIRAAPILRTHNLAYRNVGNFKFEECGASWGLDELSVSFGAAFGDLDGDGDLDLVYTHFEGVPTVLRNDGISGNGIRIALHGTRSNRMGFGARVELESESGRQVRTLLSARGYLSASEPVVHFGLGEDRTVRRLVISWPSGQRQELHDLEANRSYTVTESAVTERAPVPVAAAVTPAARFEDATGVLGLALIVPRDDSPEFRQQPLLPFRQNRFGPGLAVGDLNGDGPEDLVVGGAGGQAPLLVLRTADGPFAAKPLAERADWAADGAPLLFDVEGDGRPDLFLPKGEVLVRAEGERLRPALVMNRGGGRFKQAPAAALPAWASAVGPVVSADFDGDGHSDLFLGGRPPPGTADGSGTSAVWLYRKDGYTPAAAVGSAVPGNGAAVAGALATDFDGDGRPDLVLATQWGTVQAWRNLGSGQFEDVTARLGFEAAGRGLWSSVAAADFNGDGRMDYVVGNLGLNTPYRGNTSEPFALDVLERKTGGVALFESIAVSGGRVPWRARSTLAAALPEVARRFPTSRSYAEADAGAIAAAVGPVRARLELSELRSGIFLSQSDGAFRFAPLPWEAQLFPVFGLVAGDLDGDGLADLALVGNSSAPASEIGPFDGGLSALLVGDGRGGLRALSTRESGLVVAGDGRALVRLDLNGDGWPDLVGTRAGGECFAYLNQPRAGCGFRQVRLVAASGAGAVGAQLKARHRSGRVQAFETAVGGGWLSQNSEWQFIGNSVGDPVVEYEVRWPGGRVSRAEAAAEVMQVLTQP
jgi:enediyne biosynthesis protein E4